MRRADIKEILNQYEEISSTWQRSKKTKHHNPVFVYDIREVMGE